MFGRDIAVGFALPPDVPVETARIRGRVIAGDCRVLSATRVTVAGTEVPLAGDGQYDVVVRERGLVLVNAGPRASKVSWNRGVSTEVRLDGRGEYTAPELTISRCD